MIFGGSTVIIQEAVISGLRTYLAVIVTVPFALPVTTPFLSTTAIVSSEDDQTISLSAIFSGVKMTVSVSLSSTMMEVEVLFKAILGQRTVTVQDAKISGFETERTIMLATPPFFPVTTPLLSTVAIDSSEDDHSISLSDVSSGV